MYIFSLWNTIVFVRSAKWPPNGNVTFSLVGLDVCIRYDAAVAAIV